LEGKNNWVSGFTDGEGSFSVSISQRNQVLVIFQIELLVREEHLIRKIQEFFFQLGGGESFITLLFHVCGVWLDLLLLNKNI
jgi:hypothetical protein